MTIQESDGRLICLLDGHYDTLRCQSIEAGLKSNLAAPKPVTFDMHAVTYVCSAFLRVCLLASRLAGHGQFVIRGVTPPIKRVFLMAGLAELLAEHRSGTADGS